MQMREADHMSTPLADMVEHMLSTGISAETIVGAIRAAEQHAQSLVAGDPVATKRRVYDRERKQKKSTGMEAQKEIPPTPPKEKHPTLLSSSSEFLFEVEDCGLRAPARARRNDRASRLPDDWAPTDGDLAFAATVLPEPQISIERDKFRDHWRARAGPTSVKRDWNATWRNWCRKAVEINGTQNGKSWKHRSNGHGLTAAIDGHIERLERRVAARDGEDSENPRRLV